MRSHPTRADRPSGVAGPPAGAVPDPPESPTRAFEALPRRYRLLQPVARGATATVWRARDLRRHVDVAIKHFHPQLVANPGRRRRLAAEAAAARRVSHPNVVTPVATIATRDDLALVMPYVEGITLARRLAQREPLTPRAAAHVAIDIAHALAAVHGAGLVHSDVKPGNILLATDGRARLLDFGVSRSTGSSDRMPREPLALGTLPYMPPEQLHAGPATAASDVYALAAVLYEMLAGRRPFLAASPMALAGEQRLPPARIDGIPDQLMTLTLGALAADPQRRPTIADFATRLEAWTSSAPGEAPATRPTQPPRFLRPIGTITLVGALALALAFAVFVALDSGLGAGTAPPAAIAIDNAATPSTPPTPSSSVPASPLPPSAPPLWADGAAQPPMPPPTSVATTQHARPGHSAQRHHRRHHGRKRRGHRHHRHD